MSAAYKAAGIRYAVFPLVIAYADALPFHSYNRLLAISGRVLRRSLKEDKRIAAERRGESELRVAFWKVCTMRHT